MITEASDTFSARTTTVGSVFSQSFDFLHDFVQLLFDLLGIWSGIKVVVNITLWFSTVNATFRRGRRICKGLYQDSAQYSLQKKLHRIGKLVTYTIEWAENIKFSASEANW